MAYFMAQVDSRLQPLFAAMNAAGYDWIVSEILDVIRQGRSKIAIESDLENVRAKIDQQDEAPESISEEIDVTEMLGGDDQIDLVVGLIKARFDSLAPMLNESKERLGIISARSEAHSSEPKLVFQIDGENRFVTPHAIAELSENVEKLNNGVSDWAKSVRTIIGDVQ